MFDSGGSERHMRTGIVEMTAKTESERSRVRTCRLAELAAGERALVVRIEFADGETSASTASRLAELGFVRGTRVTMMKSAMSGDPIRVRLRGYELTLRRRAASSIIVSRDGE